MTSSRNAAWDDDPAGYDELRGCWLNERRLLFLAEKLRREPPGRVRNVLEIGSGTGWLLRRLAASFPEIAFHGVEPLGGYVEFARSASKTPNVSYSTATAECVDQIGLPAMDVVLSNDVLHHITAWERAIAAVSAVSAADCVWHAVEPNWLNVYSLIRQASTPGERVFWPWRFAGLLRGQHWRKSQTGYLFLIPPFVREAPEWSRKLEREIEWIPCLAGGIYQRFQLLP